MKENVNMFPKARIPYGTWGTFDRTSDSPVGVFPERRAHQRTMALSDVWDHFGFDPAAHPPNA